MPNQKPIQLHLIAPQPRRVTRIARLYGLSEQGLYGQTHAYCIGAYYLDERGDVQFGYYA